VLKSISELKKKETYTKKKELDRLRNKLSKMKQTVTSSTVVRKEKLYFFKPSLGISGKKELILICLYAILGDIFWHVNIF
jgi:hypothetical protein